MRNDKQQNRVDITLPELLEECKDANTKQQQRAAYSAMAWFFLAIAMFDMFSLVLSRAGASLTVLAPFAGTQWGGLAPLFVQLVLVSLGIAIFIASPSRYISSIVLCGVLKSPWEVPSSKWYFVGPAAVAASAAAAWWLTVGIAFKFGGQGWWYAAYVALWLSLTIIIRIVPELIYHMPGPVAGGLVGGLAVIAICHIAGEGFKAAGESVKIGDATKYASLQMLLLIASTVTLAAAMYVKPKRYIITGANGAQDLIREPYVDLSDMHYALLPPFSLVFKTESFPEQIAVVRDIDRSKCTFMSASDPGRFIAVQEHHTIALDPAALRMALQKERELAAEGTDFRYTVRFVLDTHRFEELRMDWTPAGVLLSKIFLEPDYLYHMHWRSTVQHLRALQNQAHPILIQNQLNRALAEFYQSVCGQNAQYQILHDLQDFIQVLQGSAPRAAAPARAVTQLVDALNQAMTSWDATYNELVIGSELIDVKLWQNVKANMFPPNEPAAERTDSEGHAGQTGPADDFERFRQLIRLEAVTTFTNTTALHAKRQEILERVNQYMIDYGAQAAGARVDALQSLLNGIKNNIFWYSVGQQPQPGQGYEVRDGENV